MIVYNLCFFRHLVPPTPGGVFPAAKNLQTELECFSFFLTDEILSKIVDYTNQYIIALLQKIVELHGEDHLKKLRSKSPYIRTISLNDLKASIYIQYVDLVLGIYMIYLSLHCEFQLHYRAS